MSDMEVVTLAGTESGHGINIADIDDDGVVVGSVEHGSPAQQSDKIAKGRLRAMNVTLLQIRTEILTQSVNTNQSVGNMSPKWRITRSRLYCVYVCCVAYI